ncbi:hypothetical protein UlMin_014458 [Ulmus minor]
MSTSRSGEQWDEEFECLIDLTLGLMALNEGQRYVNRIQRMPMHTSIRTGHQYMLELINDHPDRLFNKIRMYRPCFEMLIQVLRQQTVLQNSRFLTLEEQVMIFIYVISQKAINRMAMEDWQHSGSTISIVFTRICKAIASLSPIFIKTPNFDDVPDEIRFNPKYYPYFQDCVGAIDGTHIAAHAPSNVANNYRGRKSNVTTNMLAVCSFDMLFTYVVTGWEGAVHDSRVLTTQLEDPNSGFPHPPPGIHRLIFVVLFDLLIKLIMSLPILVLYNRVGKYYLVDSGYSNKPGYLAPFQRCFGVLKARFPILRFMTNFSLVRQREIAMCCCVLHNFIKLHNRDDPLFQRFGVDGVMPPPDSDDEDNTASSSGIAANPHGYGGNDENLANSMRDHIMIQMYLHYNM